MTLDEIIKSAAAIEVFEDRGANASYAELVFNTKDAGRWDDILKKFLGAAVKTSGSPPSSAHSDLTRPFGGVYKDQTLYHHKAAGVEIIAMFWPWQNGQQVTLKLAKLK